MAEAGRASAFGISNTTPSLSFSFSSHSVASKAMAGASNLLKLLPTGTVIVFQFLSPLLSNNGDCHLANKFATGALLILCAASCAFSCFTDSFSGSDGKTYYGIATRSGMLVFGGHSSIDLSVHRLRFGDFIHAFFSVFVLAAVALLDTKTAVCYYPSLLRKEKALAVALPPVVGAISSFVFTVFPNKRRGIGYAEVPSTTK
ncbi:protein DMP2-like [Nymphaea colorata]|uniref:DUF679 domain-containing protein n=1 Tax=Nymphaea colorata TaxID=210225 RepID=A0A5K1BL63_9MAGN|nr:protein DMP2-like [Nymphaea colorata]